MPAIAPPQTEPAPQPPAPAQPLTCTQPAPGSNLNQEAARVQALLEKTQGLQDPGARALVQDCLQSLLGFYGDGLSRMLALIEEIGEPGHHILQRFAGDPGVSALLLIHGLHPVDVETRLRGALETVRPYMQSHGGNVELISLDNGFAQLRLQGTCKSCPSSTVTLELAVRRAIEEACPDLVGFEVVNS